VAEWVYKAKSSEATYEDTLDLAGFHHFLVRSAYEPGNGEDGLREVVKVPEVALGDTIHYYFRHPAGKVAAFGSYTVVSADAFPGMFLPCEGHGALVSVIEPSQNAKFLERLDRGYERDPKLNLFTGWVINRVPAPAQAPRFDQGTLFPSSMTTLWQYPDSSLPRKKKA